MGVSRDMAILLPKLVNEFIGTFFLVLVVCITGTNGDVYKCTGITPAVAIGGMLMVPAHPPFLNMTPSQVLVFMGGHVSGFIVASNYF